MTVFPLAKTRSRPRVSMRQIERPKSPAHLQWVRTLPCCLTGSPVGVVAHHLMEGDASAMGARSGDDQAVPIVHHLHDQQHPHGLHRDGCEARWWKRMGVDPFPIARRLWLASIAAGRVRATDAERQAAAAEAGDVDTWLATNYGRPRVRSAA